MPSPSQSAGPMIQELHVPDGHVHPKSNRKRDRLMNDSEINQMAQFESYYWWHIGRREIIRSLLNKCVHRPFSRILDYGCGTGGNLSLLADFGETWGSDCNDKALSFCRGKGHVNLLSNKEDHVPDGCFELITALDVIEHVREDAHLLAEFFNIISPGGLLLISVPAYPFLWSEHDEALGHYRRYRANELREKLRAAGFEIVRSTHAISFVLLPIIIYRCVRRSLYRNQHRAANSYVTLPKSINALLALFLTIESKMVQKTDIPFGCSLLCLARRP